MNFCIESAKDHEILARTIFGEARGEYSRLNGGLSALIAVGNVVLNRVSYQSWFGKTIKDVCLKPWQFSCWNPQDPNYSILTQSQIDLPLFSLCEEVSQGLSTGMWPDLTKGADHYHASSIALPGWAKALNPLITIGHHQFYKLNPRR